MLGEFHLAISPDMMTVQGLIDEGTDEITKESVLAALNTAGVNIGIDEEKIVNMINRGTAKMWFTIAEGKQAGETTKGYFEYFFDLSNKDGKTVINEDGTVTYGRKKVEITKGEKICTYHKSISGTFGYNVFSNVIAPRPVSDLTLKAGEGVEIIDGSYFATVDGEIVLTSTELCVNNTLVIDGDAKYGIDTETKFIGAIHIKGDVLTGVSIKANGRIEIDGTVEAASIISEDDIIIKGGIKGDMAARISAKGSVICPFIENATVTADDTIQADYVMRANLTAGNSIIIHGQHGIMIGGLAVTRNEFVCDEAGNEAGVDTKIEIRNTDLRVIERSKITINKTAHDNVMIKIGNIGYRQKVKSGLEYHMVNGEIVTCSPGMYVPQRNIHEFDLGEKKTILVVDDEPIILKNFFIFLNDKYDVMLAASARDAKAMLEQREPDLILLDVKMPVMDGPEFLTSIRQNPWKNYSQIPVIFVTAAHDKETIKKCLVLYPQGYLVKPISQEDLLGAVGKYFNSDSY